MRVTAIALIVLLASFLTAAARDAAKPARPVIVTVTKTDGTIVKGTLTASDPKSVSVQPLVKNVPQGDVVTVAWGDVKSVSNGLTRLRAIEQWKKDHPDDRCADCHAAGHVDCGACKETGREAASAKPCPTCKGEQTIACKQPRCDHGSIPCPNPCLKLTEGNWVKKDDGKMWRRFPVKGGASMEVSESHVGEVVLIKHGQPQQPVKCPVCGGAQKATCPKCGGDAMMPCATCASAARANPCPEKCQRGQVACKACDGSGLKSLAAAQ